MKDQDNWKNTNKTYKMLANLIFLKGKESKK